MICYQCQRDLKHRETYRGVHKCESLDCENMVGLGYRACETCSDNLNECEICRGNLLAIEEKFKKSYE